MSNGIHINIRHSCVVNQAMGKVLVMRVGGGFANCDLSLDHEPFIDHY